MGRRWFAADMIPRIPSLTKLSTSDESQVLRPSTPVIGQPVKLGHQWYVLARHPRGQKVHVRRFKTESEAKNWIARKPKAWLKKRGSAMISRAELPQIIFCVEGLSRHFSRSSMLPTWSFVSGLEHRKFRGQSSAPACLKLVCIRAASACQDVTHRAMEPPCCSCRSSPRIAWAPMTTRCALCAPNVILARRVTRAR